jgi:hypothetical protein
MLRPVVILSIGLLGCAALVPCAAQSPKRSHPISQELVPWLIDRGRQAAETTVKSEGLTPVSIAELDARVRAEIDSVFPPSVIERARLYFDVPLNDPGAGVGFLNTLGMVGAGGGWVLGMTFENDVYLFFSREELTDNPALPSILAHELVHVAQYQALGYEGYKARYAEDYGAGKLYRQIAQEQDAYVFQRLHPSAVPPGFFAFMETDQSALRVQTAGDALIPLEQVSELEQETVSITTRSEALERETILILRGLDPDGESVPAQLLDPVGGSPLHVFSDAGRRLVFNGPVQEGGPHIVAVAADGKTLVAWRDLTGASEHTFNGEVTFEDRDSDTRLEAVEMLDGGRSVHWEWMGHGFIRRPWPKQSRE